MSRKKTEFKSPLEAYCYEKLKANNLDAEYEPKSYVLMDSFAPKHLKLFFPKKDSAHYKATGRKRFNLMPFTTTIRNIKYTPDFVVKIGNNIVFIEIKGRVNESYPLRKKLFLRNIERIASTPTRQKYTFWFFEPHSQEHVRQMLEILVELKQTENGNN